MSPAATCVQILAQTNYSYYGVNLDRTSLKRTYQAACSKEGVDVPWFPAAAQPLAALAMVISKSLSNTGSSVVTNVLC